MQNSHVSVISRQDNDEYIRHETKLKRENDEKYKI